MSAPPIPPDGAPQPLILYLVVPSHRHPYSFGRKKASGAIAPDALNFRTRTGLSRHTVLAFCPRLRQTGAVSAGGLPPIASALNSLSGQRAKAPLRPYTREPLSARILPPRREIKSLLWRLKSPPGGRCPPPVRARGAVFFRRAAAILLLCGTASQSRLERHPLTRCCSRAPKNTAPISSAPVFASRARYSAADGLGALIQSRLTASATGDKSLLAKNAALTTTRREPSCARLLACTRLQAQCSAVSIRRFFRLCRKND